MSEVVTDNHDATFATNNFALIANLLHAWFNFHDCPPSLVPINNSTSCEVIRTQFHDDTISWEDTDVVLAHLSTDVSEDLMPVR